MKGVVSVGLIFRLLSFLSRLVLLTHLIAIFLCSFGGCWLVGLSVG